MALAPPGVSLPAQQRRVDFAAGRRRAPPTRGGLARRRYMVRATKWLLPAAALALLATIVLWPQITRWTDQARLRGRLAAVVATGVLSDAKYSGVDERGRPYTVTATQARQVTPERVNLTAPKGDVTLEGGRWLMVQSQRGSYIQHAGSLDLSGDVLLYRDDGTTMQTDTATMDLKNGAAGSADMVHAEGPFGTLDAQGFTLTDRGTQIQFAGPGHLLMNARSR